MKKNAFTLVELLVAIAIFAILSALGWKTFDHIAKIKDRNATHEENLAQLQEAYQQIQRDSIQITAVVAGNSEKPQAALILHDQSLSFTKSGVVDPLQQKKAPTERVEYHYNAQDKKLYRLKYTYINGTPNQQPVSSVLLARVDQLQMNVLNPQALDHWPDMIDPNDQTALRRLPRGFSLKFSIDDVEYEWIFDLLNTDFISSNLSKNSLKKQSSDRTLSDPSILV